MLGRFPHLSKVMIKILEIGGAGCASAVAASLLGSAQEPAHPPAVMPPAVVRLAPADEQMIKHVRDESAALVEKLRTATDPRSAAPASATAASPAPAAIAASAKPAKTVSAAAPRREQKPVRAQAEAKPEGKQRAPEPLPTQATSSLPSQRVGSAAANDARDERPTNVAAGPNEWPSTQTQVPSRLWSGASTSLRDAPRPPVAVGQFVSSSM
ncbi:MAG: hypothetical protein QOD29_5038 [Alphaproteobacteria bacterium]|jgi:hypothetical protein|nr:hypothetical protein [Alphaproteobacteria bacterium]